MLIGIKADGDKDWWGKKLMGKKLMGKKVDGEKSW